MDNIKIGQLIYRLRKENHWTQGQLAEKLGVSDKAISKWERGLGCPEVSLLPELSRLFAVDLERLLAGELDAKAALGGDMRRVRSYVCPSCGNLIAAMADAGVSCCGKKLKPLEPREAEGAERLSVEVVENEFFVTSGHPMTREHHIAFVALLTDDSLLLRKQYPEWDLQARLPLFAHGRLLWYCTRHGLFCQEV